MGVVRSTVDEGLGHDFVERGWVQVRADGEGAFLNQLSIDATDEDGVRFVGDDLLTRFMTVVYL